MNFSLPLALLSTVFLSSCGSFSNTTAKVSNPFKGIAKMNKNDLLNFKLDDLRTNTPPIVKVRPEDLKEMMSGKERYLAYHQEKQLYYIGNANGIEFLPQDFDPNNLPNGSGLTPMGILPPLNPGVSTAIDIDRDLGPITIPGNQPDTTEEKE